MKYTKDGVHIEIEQDIDPQNPRDGYNLGVMVCWHKRYTLGDKHDINQADFPSWDEIQEHITKELKAVAIFPLYMMDHSGLTIRTYPFGGSYGYWDSGQIGFIYAPKSDETDSMPLTQIENCLEAEIETYNKYVQGNVWGFSKYTLEMCDLGFQHQKHIDSCWGFYDMDQLYESAGIEDLNEWSEVK